MRDYRSLPLWKDATPEEWNDWRWQIRHSITTAQELRQVAGLTPKEEEGVRASLARFRMAITPYYACLMDPSDRNDPIRLQSVPQGTELHGTIHEDIDPLHEDVDSPVPGLTHRYPDRVLLLITDQCSMYCRHCTRRRLVGHNTGYLPPGQLQAACEYISSHPEIRDVLVSGGDAFLLGDERIVEILEKLRRIPHVEIIRFGTRTPVVLPMRITESLCRILSQYHPVYVNVHFNHPKELTPEAISALSRLAGSGIPLGNQSVLLKGINDCPVVMRDLCRGLVRARVRPYYLYQCDLSKGLAHFRTPLSRGIEIIEMMRGHVTGLAVPTFVVDGPGGGGKIPVGPNYILTYAPGRVVLRNYEGTVCVYHEPAEADRAYGDWTAGTEGETNGRGRRKFNRCPTCGTDHNSLATGLGRLLYDRERSLDPRPPRKRPRNKKP